MKLLRIIDSMNPSYGGPCQGIRNAIAEQAKQGVYNEVVCMDSPDESYPSTDNFTITCLGPAHNPWRYTPNLHSWLQLNIARFDAVIVHGLWLYYGYAVYKTIKALRKKGNTTPKLYVMPHGMLDPYFQQATDRKLKTIRNIIYWRLLENKLIHLSDGVLFTCTEELRLARTTFKLYHPKKELNVGYGIVSPPPFTKDINAAFLNKCEGLNSNEPYLLYLSRIHEKKGVGLLVEAYLELHAQGIALPKLLVAGPGLDTPFGQRILQKAAPHKAIIFPGMLTGDAKWGAFYGCEAFILPSHQENFGIAVAEALACSKPVLITDKVNIWKEIQETGAGFVQTDTLQGVMNLLLQWVQLKKAESRVMSEQASFCYKKHFAIEQSSKAFMEAIQNNQTIHGNVYGT